MIPQKVKTRVRNILNAFNKSVADKSLFYYRHKKYPKRFNEDISTNPGTEEYNPPIELKVLNNYNYMRTWPVTIITTAGESDPQSVQVFLNKDYLKGLGLLSPSGNFNYNPDLDRFVMDGIVYKGYGDTAASQHDGSDINYLITLRREDIPTSSLIVR